MNQQTITQALSYSDLRKNLAGTMDRVCDTHEPIIITRQKSRAVVMMSLEDYSSITETAYLLQSPANAQRLRSSLKSAVTGHTETHPLADSE